ncbi:MAG TPA: ABC transporter ATP-binding protein [Fastidiosipila sp.]|jgi:ABC-2 type transport system ATP-binding protein|nr:ABC transporter ATP-binding protein [Fastidiosipila sp.]
MLEIINVTKTYGKVIANDHVSGVVPENTVALLVGPNGAGKSTLLKSIMGLLRYRGEIRLSGHDAKSVEAKRLLGYVPEMPEPYPLLTIAEHMELIARLYKLTDWEERADALLRRFELDDKRDKLGGELSKGMQQKISICTAMLPEPQYILFDEPLVGLDPYAIAEVKQMFRELASSGRSLLISTHILDTVDDLWDKVMIMNEGKIIEDVSRAELDARDESLEALFFRITKHNAEASS